MISKKKPVMVRWMIPCKECIFWHRYETIGTDRGTCRRYAPGLGNGWMETEEGEWCGDGSTGVVR